MNRTELIKIQEEYTRSLFDTTYQIKSKILSSYYKNRDEYKYRAEVTGRRFLVAKELLFRFPKTIEVVLQKEEVLPFDFITSDRFDFFFKSEDFLKNKNALPVAEGFGKGYENNSKFFFWFMTNSNNQDAKEKICIEFSIYLIQQQVGAIDKFFSKFENGIWIELGDEIILISPNLDILEIRDSETIEQIKKSAIFNLNKLLNCKQ